MPTHKHQNHWILFKLARAIKTLESNVGRLLSLQEKREAFFEWYRRVQTLGLLRADFSRDDYLIEFMNADRKAKLPLGENPVEQALRRARSEPFPKEAELFETEKGKLLTGLCFQLHLSAKGKSWFLPTRTASRLLGWSSPTTAGTWLSAMVQMGIIKVVDEATTQKATRYLYLGQ
jgi:hypothetical protein